MKPEPLITRYLRRRYLTANECNLLRPIFKQSLDYAAMRVAAKCFMPFQAAQTAITPNGIIYLPQNLYAPDFAQSSWTLRQLFIHECAHVWQHRLGYPVLRCGICLALQGGYYKNRAYRYRHLLRDRQDIAQFNMEQQAEIIAEYFTVKFQHGIEDPALKPVLQRFLHNPADSSLLPEKMRI
ncbi:hypothetical protein [Kingella negevensis]|uniref:DUF4157 domain-containing protein n=1 Tax=Kingella negevensis TaxID=1522312 RepID=A0A238HIG6_9NEIS|nr:hypothetical protein [Kingella negevensis]MDK4679996.1 type IV secretion protein Rhs [Kingella negevensis]MDK4682284.1 type IV secretion protein Rhs [Kingella negevensis]MDK4684852.1 type IV secretion protein Rhs [Kingella negevensis]MDK4688308.1 type IV secretion protein Rhs [Kingella negevensis]MDK4690481.1 type IV secretion protein Rhs [Kingella negevensis]